MPDGGKVDVEPDAEEGDSEMQPNEDRPPPAQRRRSGTQQTQTVRPPTGEMPAIMPPPRPAPDQIMQEIATELTRIGQDLTYPLAKHGVGMGSDDMGAAFTRLDCGSRVFQAAARLAELLTPPNSPELDQGQLT